MIPALIILVVLGIGITVLLSSKLRSDVEARLAALEAKIKTKLP